MRAQLLIDNWTLQDCGHLLDEGFSGGTVPEIEFTKGGRDFRYKKVQEDLVRLDCLLKVLGAIVYSDRLFVDQTYQYTWADAKGLRVLSTSGLVVGSRFLDVEDQWAPQREAFAEELCVCKRIRDVHQRNREMFARIQRPFDNRLSSILWGGAGYLARGEHSHVHYMPHPLRERLFERASFLLPGGTALRHFEKFVAGERVKLFTRVDLAGGFACLALPPAPALIVKEASGPADLVKLALQVRADFADLRHWLGELQEAFALGDMTRKARAKKLLRSVATNVDALTGDYSDGQTSIQVGCSWAKVTVRPGALLNAAWNKFGVRAAVNRLVVADAGRDGLRKLIGFFESNPARVRKIERAFLDRASLMAPKSQASPN